MLIAGRGGSRVFIAGRGGSRVLIVGRGGSRVPSTAKGDTHMSSLKTRWFPNLVEDPDLFEIEPT